MSDRGFEQRDSSARSDWVLHAMMRANRVFTRAYHRMRVLSPCPVSPSGPGILICNHTSGLDPLLLQAATPRPLTWMIAREYYELPGIRWIGRHLRMIPTSRDGRDSAATRAALRALEQGALLGIFPEGRIEPERELLPFHQGVAMLAVRTGVPIYPARLEGTQRGRSVAGACLWPGRATLRFGSPIQFSGVSGGRDQLRAVTDQLHQAIGLLDKPDRRSL